MEKIMGNSKVKFSNVCYVITGISIILIIAILSNYFSDTKHTSQEIKKEIQITGARIASEYIYDFFEGRKASLSLLGRCLTGIGTDNSVVLEEQLSAEADLFDSIIILDKEGSFICGYGTYNIEDIQKESGFEIAAEGGCAIAEELIPRQDGELELMLYAPVMDVGGKVKAVLAGSLLESTLTNYMESKFAGSGAFAAVINNRGRIMYGSSGIYKVIGETGSSFFSFIKACKVYTENAGTDYIQGSIHDREEIFLEYAYERNKFVAACIPLEVNNCYIVYIANADNAGIGSKLASVSNSLLVKLLIADLVVIFGILFYHINGRAKVIKLLDNYGVLDRQEGAVLFEYVFSPKKRIDVFGDFSHVTGKNFSPLVGEAVYDVYEYVHEDDASIRGRLHEFFDSEDEVFSSEVRILDQNGDYGWYRLTGTMFRSSDGNCERFVGKVVNANKQISMEKNLVQRAENDLLTGVLNKKTIEAKITEQLKDKHEGRNYIFFMVDLDNFKNVNDNLGHIYGDKAIADTAAALTGIFHSNAFIGRLGGDEFAVFAIYDAFDEESLMKFIVKNAEKVCEANRREYSDGANTIKISSSVGISIGPKDGRDFELLYKKADEALYNSKKTGKNKFTIYGSGNNKD